jgi:hypothetical protein
VATRVRARTFAYDSSPRRLGDLVAELVQLRGVTSSKRMDLHGESLLLLRRLYTLIFGPPESVRDGRSLDEK